MNPHLKHHAVIKMLLNEAKLELKGNAVPRAAESLSWFNSLDKLLEKVHAHEMKRAEEPSVKPIRKKAAKKAVKK